MRTTESTKERCEYVAASPERNFPGQADSLEIRLRPGENAGGSLRVLSQADIHDLRNFLSAILGFAELVTNEAPEDSTARARADRIVTAAHGASQLVRQAQHEICTGAETLEIENAASLIHKTVDCLEAFLGPRTKVGIALEKAMPPVAMAAADLSRVVMNLYINACQAIGNKAGVISISAMAAPRDTTLTVPFSTGPRQFVRLVVADTGPGMDAATLNKIREPHFSTKPGGQGLGLAATDDIVCRYGGTLTIESTQGRGSSFYVRLPCIDIAQRRRIA